MSIGVTRRVERVSPRGHGAGRAARVGETLPRWPGRRAAGAELARSRGGRRRAPGAGRAVRLRQVDRAPPGRGARRARQRQRRPRRAGRDARATSGPRRGHGLPGVRALPAPLGAGQHRLPSQDARRARCRAAAARGRGGRHARHRPAARSPAGRALGRGAAARRHGPRHRAPPAGVPLRRAALQPRRRAPHRAARGDRGAGAAPRGDLALRDPRPDRGHDHGRSHRRHARRRAPAGRPAARHLPGSGQRLRGGLPRVAADQLDRSHPPRGPARRRGRDVAGAEGRGARARASGPACARSRCG